GRAGPALHGDRGAARRRVAHLPRGGRSLARPRANPLRRLAQRRLVLLAPAGGAGRRRLPHRRSFHAARAAARLPVRRTMTTQHSHRWSSGLFGAVGALLLSTWSGVAAASQTYPAAVQEALDTPCPPPCTVCHTTPTGGLGQLTKFGENLRSEEHTSELQSRENLVCRLLLE